MDLQPGDMVEIVDIGELGGIVKHPTESRMIQNGDIFVVEKTDSIFVHLKDIPGGGIYPRRFKKVEQAIIENDCTCPDLLNGHHTGCPYLRKD